jgi:tetratricopeptide (TPR) repeat protein
VSAVISLDSQTFLGHNQATYQNLRLALQLNLRRQLLLAICDDVTLQGQLAQRLEADLNTSSLGGITSPSMRPGPCSPMVTLPLNIDNPDPVRQVLLWLKQHRLLKASAQTIPAFQIVGIEYLTGRSPTLQNKFLASLTYVDALITRLDCRLLIWVPRPWVGKIQQAVPTFWRSRSGSFEFVGDPTPTPKRPVSFDITPRQSKKTAAPKPPGTQIELPRVGQSRPQPGNPTRPHPPMAAASPDKNLWTVLREDLSAFEHPELEAKDLTETKPHGTQESADWPVGPAQAPLTSTGLKAGVYPQSQSHGPTSVSTRFTVVDEASLTSVIFPPSHSSGSAADPAALGATKPASPTELLSSAAAGATKPAPPTEPSDLDVEHLHAPAQLRLQIQAQKLSSTPKVAEAEGLSVEIPRPEPRPATPGRHDLNFIHGTPSVDDLPRELATDDEVVALWQYVQTLEAKHAGPLTLSRAYLGLAQKGRDLLESGTVNPPLLDFAIQLYRQAIHGLLEGDENWCDALNDLASLYWLRSQREETPEAVVDWLQRSIKAYQTALKGSQPSADLEPLLRLYSNLGTVHSLLASLDEPLANLQESQMAYKQALLYAPVDKLPIEYANLQNSLGAVHWRLAQLGDQPQHQLQLAIKAYAEALTHRSPEDTPLDYAMIQNNIGIAYWSLAQHEDSHLLLENAITAYQMALQYRTPETLPHGCAATHNNLGTAYWDLAQQCLRDPDQRLDHLRKAVAAYENALNVAEVALQVDAAKPLGFDVWATFHSAGVVHDQLAQGLSTASAEQRRSHLQQALQHYLLAYQGWQDNPQQLDVLVAALVYNVHLSFDILGLTGQQAVLSQIPGELLPAILGQL